MLSSHRGRLYAAAVTMALNCSGRMDPGRAIRDFHPAAADETN
ncbi:MAG TPA: hypothetical protein VGD45_30370 [Steroidobacter sp.]